MTNGPVVLTYLDAYQKERQVSYDNIDHCLLAFSGCFHSRFLSGCFCYLQGANLTFHWKNR